MPGQVGHDGNGGAKTVGFAPPFFVYPLRGARMGWFAPTLTIWAGLGANRGGFAPA